MKFKNRLKREFSMFPVIRAGYSRKMASIWYKKTRRDKKNYKEIYDKKFIKEVHKKGFLCDTLERYNWGIDDLDNYISNFDYIYLEPFNNSFSKWLQDIITTNRILKDYDSHLRKVFYNYHWLNRINNAYQIWINDKTTFRYILEPFKEYIPQYYFSIFNRNGKTEIEKMQDCDTKYEANYDGIIETLKDQKILALKPSAGTHGDGFYCLTFENGEITVNGECKSKEQFIELVESFKSFYLITEYIDMNNELKKIYPKSVNSIRVMVINENGYEPKIMQSYMRIGSSRTGYTDNVGYGGICVMIDTETGEMYNPETIVEHKFYPCPKHPDTGTMIEGKIPYWEEICEGIKRICRYLSELEYLGFDIAVTNDGFQVIEINIHQDLHKVATLDKEVIEFYERKMRNKLSMGDEK